MNSVHRLRGVCRKLFILSNNGLDHLSVKHIAAGITQTNERFLNTRASVPSNQSDVVRKIVNACQSKDNNQWKASLEVRKITRLQLEKPVIFSPDTEKLLQGILTAHPLNDLGMAVLKFVLKHGEKDSKLERNVLADLMQHVDTYNALGLATVIENVTFVNTDLRWSLVKRFKQELQEGLSLETDSFVIKSMPQYKDSPLLAYLLDNIYHRQTYTGPKIPYNALNFIHQNGVHDYSLCRKMESSIERREYKKFRFSPAELKNLLSASVVSDSRSVLYMRVLSLHLKFNLSLIQEPDDMDDRTRSVLTACLVSYAMKGFYEEEVIAMLVDKANMENMEKTSDIMKIFSALSMLNHEDIGGFKDKMAKIMDTGYALNNLTYKAIRPLVEQQWLGEEHLNKLMAREVTNVKRLISRGKHGVSYNDVCTYFLLKAYSEIDLDIPVTTTVDEDALLKAMPPMEESVSPLKKSLLFVVGQMLGDESLLRSFFMNKYGHVIDVEFFLDNEGTVHPEKYAADLTRFVLILFEPNDVICCASEEGEHFEPRGSHRLKITQLSKLDNTEVITIYFNEWKDLGNRYDRQEFLKAEIDAKLEKRCA